MNRLQFLKLMGLGAVAAAVAPHVLIPKSADITWSEPIVTDFTQILAMQESIMNSIAGVGWYTQQEALAILDRKQRMEYAFLSGERRETNRKFYTGGIWTENLK